MAGNALPQWLNVADDAENKKSLDTFHEQVMKDIPIIASKLDTRLLPLLPDEDDAPLPQPGDMHVEFKKSSLPNTVNKSKIQFIPFRLLQENKNVLCEKIVELEQEISKLKEENCVLKRKLKDKPTTSSSPPSPKKET